MFFHLNQFEFRWMERNSQGCRDDFMIGFGLDYLPVAEEFHLDPIAGRLLTDGVGEIKRLTHLFSVEGDDDVALLNPGGLRGGVRERHR
ncbi:MAG: hypothetical protein MPW15_10215 [Candidatus Manganitrophus sp.]|nr:hypothetical protein [Candidatus Manganitrophus sp.]